MCISWENVILSWVNVCAVCSEHINTLEDLADEKLLGCFIPSCMKDAADNQHQKTIKFIQRQYPRFWTQMPSELQNEDTLIIYSLLIHYYSFIDDPLMRNKMCSLSNASQVQIKRFLEFLLNKDITKDTVKMAIKSCCESPVQSLIKFFENSRKESKTPLGDYLKLPNNRPHTLPRVSQELKKEPIRKGRVNFLRTQLSDDKSESGTVKRTGMDKRQKISTEVSGCKCSERESSTSVALTIADSKIDKDTSLEWDYTDVFEDLCATAICDSTTDILPEDSQNVNETLLKDLNSLERSVCLERDSLRAEIEEKDLKLRDFETKITLMQKEIILKNEELISKEKEVAKLTDIVEMMSEDNLKMSKKVKLLQDELNMVSEWSSNELEPVEKKERITKDKKTQNRERLEEELIATKEITLKETTIFAKIEGIAKLVNEIESMHQDCIEIQNIILNLCKEQKSFQKTVTENELGDFIVKDESSHEKDNQIEKYVETINTLTKDLHKKNHKIVVLFEKALTLKEELTQLKIAAVHNFADIKSLLENIVCENYILRNDKLESEEVIEELNSKIHSLEEDLIEKKRAVDNLINMHVEESVSLQTTISDEQIRAAEVLKKYTFLKIEYVEKSTECEKMKAFYEEQLSDWKEQIQADFNQEKESIIMHYNSTIFDLEKSLELYKRELTKCHDDAFNLRNQLRNFHEKMLKVNDEKGKLETKLLSLNRNKAKYKITGERHAFIHGQNSEELNNSSCERGPIAPLPVERNPELVTQVERETSTTTEPIDSRIDVLLPQTEGNELNA